jgi:hypothetical protein
LALTLIFIGDFLFRFWRAKKSKILLATGLGVISHLICSLGVFTIQTAVTGITLIILYGLAEGELRNE